MAEQPPNVRLNLANTAENVVLVREMLAGVAQAIELSVGELNDIHTAVTEACNNVVLHAYAGRPGSMEIEVRLARGTFGVVVRDRGGGIRAQPEDTDGSSIGGIGLHVIRTLAHSVQFNETAREGTEVCMEFAISGMDALEARPDALENQTFSPEQALPTTISIAPISLAADILPRLVSALAARAHFSTDRISDAQLLADALVAHAGGAMSGDHLSIGVDVEPRTLELRIAPLDAGRAQRLIGDSTVEGLGRVIEKLIDHHRVATDGSHETLTLSLVDRH
jgi:serine/threonine-protein kinase RsbW